MKSGLFVRESSTINKQENSNIYSSQQNVTTNTWFSSPSPTGWFLFLLALVVVSRRRKTRTVMVGTVPVGSEHPVAIQTMTNTPTTEVEATVLQIQKASELGVDIVRCTTQGQKEVKAVGLIRERLEQLKLDVPLVADVHFNPKVAINVAEHVDKVRINPGNFVDGTKTFDQFSGSLTDDFKLQWRSKLEQTLLPLIDSLKKYNRALRIGVNHGSLSERVLLEYGDTPEGMVASAMEFIEICRAHDFHNIIISMKSSNPVTMVHAYRVLVKELSLRGWDYPLHLGVTESGSGVDGRIKSSVGIGGLLSQGIGDTIRASLTEDPWCEISPCLAIANAAKIAINKDPVWLAHATQIEPTLGVPYIQGVTLNREPYIESPPSKFVVDQLEYNSRPTKIPELLGFHKSGTVFASPPQRMLLHECRNDTIKLFTEALGFKEIATREITSFDGFLLDQADGDLDDDEFSELCHSLIEANLTLCVRTAGRIPLPNKSGCNNIDPLGNMIPMLRTSDQPVSVPHVLVLTGHEIPSEVYSAIKRSPIAIIFKGPQNINRCESARNLIHMLSNSESGEKLPIIFWYTFNDYLETDDDIARASIDLGSLFLDGVGDGICWAPDMRSNEFIQQLDMLRTSSFNFMQAARKRISKTEFISCPSCGRTLFNLQEVENRIRKRTGHLPGVRIAVMGCIVNGPGEMADADFGYVGTTPGHVDLYVGKQVETRNVPEDDAEDKLVELIKAHNMWVEPIENN